MLLFYNFINYKHDYIISNGEYDSNKFFSAYPIKYSNILTLGSPRIDVLYNDIKNAELFSEKDCNNIFEIYKTGKKIIFFMPTFRCLGQNVTEWIEKKKLQEFLSDNNIILVCKLHHADKNNIKDSHLKNVYIMDSWSDCYPILKYSTALITDYSSIAFDYLILNKPIIYYPFDLQEYCSSENGLYIDYEEFAVGTIAKNEEELLKAMQDVINGIDNYKEQRKVLRDKMFLHQDGKNCERIVEWIKSLD